VCARTCVQPPSFELGAFDLFDPDDYSFELQEIERDLISPCIELLTSISWERLAAEYSQGQREMSSRARALSQADADFYEARRDLRALEGQMAWHLAWYANVRTYDTDPRTLALLSWRTGVLERQVGDASRSADYCFTLFRQCSREYDAARAHLYGLAEHERNCRDRASALLDRLGRELEDLLD
jgi:hypothetical protein